MARATHCARCGVELNATTQSAGIRNANRARCNACERERKAKHHNENRKRYNQLSRNYRAREAAKRPPKPTFLERFMAKVEIREASDCWWWTAATSSHWGPYGVVNIGRENGGGVMLAHRAAFKFLKQEDPGDLFVCHSCDNPLCVNPEHLFLGTAKDNAQDAVKKGRVKRGQKAVDVALTAKRVARRKLTEWQAIEIFKRVMSGEPAKTIAKDYGVTPRAVHAIRNGDTWSHATGLTCRRHHWKFDSTENSPLTLPQISTMC